MNASDFYFKIDQHEDLKYLGIKDGLVYIGHKPTHGLWEVQPQSIEGNDWAMLEAVLTAKRQAKVLHYWTRIVGYYSDTANWNLSKVGELKDRHKGDYSLPEASDG